MLPKNTIAIWTVDQRLIGSVGRYQQHLSLEEQAKAKRFRFEKDRSTFIIGRGILRQLLGLYTESHPAELQINYGEQGKPYISGPDSLHFNISHSGKILVMAFSRQYPLGVDVEQVKSDFDVLTIAKHYFSSKEQIALKKLKDSEQPRGFYRCWTRKESFIKAKGSGLSFPLDAFTVSLEEDQKAEILETNWDKSERHEWHILPFIPSEGYLASLCVRAKHITTEHHIWGPLNQ